MNIPRRSFVLPLIALLLAPAALPAAVIWIEGEKPVRSTMHRHPWWYDKVKRDQLSGGDLMSNFHEQPGEAAYDVAAPKAGSYDFWVRANPLAAQLAYRLGGRDWKEIDLVNNARDQINIAGDGKPDLRFLAWIRVGKVELKQGANRIEFRMFSKNHNHGYLDCFVLADEPFEPRGKLKPGEMAAALRQLEAENRGWFAFAPRSETFDATSAFDLRSLNEPIAGDGGRIAVEDGHFVHSATGQAVRFWAMNGPPHELKDPEALRRCGRLVAKYGVNLVRIHGGHYDESGNILPEKVQHTLDVVEAMKHSGIYSHLSIYFPLWLKPKPGTPWLEGYDGNRHPFAALYFNRDFQRQYREWWKAVLLTPNRATGKRLIDEPALASVEIINEDSYLFWTFTPQNIPDVQLRIVETQFGDWLTAKYGSLEKAAAQWHGQKTGRDAPSEGRMGFRPLWNMFTEKSARDKDTVEFLVRSQREFYRQTYAFLREIGFRGLITASNWATASPEVFGPLEKLSYTPGDFIDRHGYFDCNHKGNNDEWSIRPGHTYRDRSALRFEAEQAGKPRLFVHPVMDPHYAGKPSMISETTFCRPNRYRSEAPLFYAAYAALQDSDAIVHFALDSSTWAVKPNFFMQPWTLLTPAMAGQFPAAALVYRKGLVAPGETMVDLSLSVPKLLELGGTPLPQDAAFEELRAKDVPSDATLRPGNVIDPLVHFVGRTNVTFTKEAGSARLRDLKPYIDRQQQTVASSTGQLRLDYGRGVLQINAPAAQGASGALNKAGEVELKDLIIASDLELGHIMAVSLDDRPLATSRRILLQAMSEEKGTGFQAEPIDAGRKRIIDIGRDPWLVKELRGTVKFRRADASGLQVVPLDHSGYPQKPAGDAREIRLAPTTLYYLITAR